MEQHFHLVSQWLAQHPDWVLFTIALVSFLESLAVVGILVPGIATLFAASTVAGSSGFSVWPMLFAGFIGAVLGDGLSYLLGYRYHHVVRRVPPFSTHPQWIERGENFFREYGTMSIALGRFFGPIRAIIPLVAGLMEMPPVRFFTVNIISAMAWSPFYLMPGYLVGKSVEGNNALQTRHLIFLLGVILCGWLFAQFVRHLHAGIHSRQNKRQLAIWLTGVLLSLFVVLGFLAKSHSLDTVNQHMAHWMLTLRHGWLDPVLVGLTSLGEYGPMTIWAVLVTLALLLQRNIYAAVLWVGGTLLANLLMELGKHGFAVARPDMVAFPPHSFAYPSGHTCMILVFVGLLTALSLPSVSARRHQLILSFGGILISLVAATRLYFTVHWLTDIVGGLLLGAGVLALFYTVVLYRPFPRVRPLPLLVASLLAWSANITIFALPHIAELLARYQPLAGH